MMPEGVEALGGAPQGVGAPPVAFSPSWHLLRDFNAVSPSSRENISVVFFLELIGPRKVPEIAKYERFSASQKLNTNKEDFVGKSPKII